MAIRDEIVLDYTGYKRDLNKVDSLTDRSGKERKKSYKDTGRSIERTNDSINRSTKKVENGFNRSGNNIKAGMLISFAAIAAGAAKMFQYIRSGLERGREIEEISSKYETVLGDSIQTANVFIKENARLLGLSTIKAKEYYANIVNIAQGMGFAKDEAIPFSEEILKLAGDLQSFNDVPIEQTQRAIVSALTGEREALKTLGIVVNEEMVKQQAMTQFKLEDVKAINQQQKAQATLTLITQKAGKAIGDLERTQNSSSNRYRQNLAKMNDMLDSLSTKLNEGFGNDLIMWMTKGLDLAEDLVDEINKLTSSGTENLIRDLRSNNADPELIAKLEEAQALADAQKLKMSIEKELRDIKVPVNIDEAFLLDKTKGFLSSLKKSFGVKGLFSGEGSIFNIGQQIKDVRQELANFKIEEEGFQSGNLDKYKQRLDEMVVSLKNLSELSIEARKNGFDEEADLFISEANAYGDAISQLAEIIAKMERVNQINDQLRNKGGVDLEQTVKVTGESVEKFVSDIERIELKPVKIGVNVEPKADTDKFDTVLSSSFSKISAKYLKEIAKLNEMFATDMISEDKFLKDSEVTTIAFKEALIDLYKEAKKLGKLTPELEKAFNKALGEMNDGTKEAKTNLDDIADAVSGLLSVADAFGKIDDNLKNVIRGGIDVLRNLQNIQELQDAGKFSGLGAVVPLIGLAGGVGSILSTFFTSSDGINTGGDIKSDEEIRELKKSISENILAIRSNTRAILESQVVGFDVKQSQIDQASSAFRSLQTYANDFKGYFNKKDIQSLLTRLQNALPDVFDGVLDLFNDKLDSGVSLNDALKDLFSGGGGFEGISSLFNNFVNEFGKYGQSINAFINRFNRTLQFSAETFETSFNSFVSNLESLGLNIPEELMNQLRDIDFNSEDGLNELDKIIASLYENRLDFQGDLTPDEFNTLLDFLDSLKGGVEHLMSSIDLFVEKLKKNNIDLSKEIDASTLDITDFQNNDTVSVGQLIEYLQGLSPLTDSEEISKVLNALKNNLVTILDGMNDDDANILKELIENISANGLTESSLKNLQELLSGGSEVSRSVAVSSSITEFQANEMVTWLQALNFTADMQLDVSQQQAQLLRDQIFLLSNLGSNENGVAHLDMGPALVQSNNNSFQVNVSGGTFSDQEINSITNQIARELKTYAK